MINILRSFRNLIDYPLRQFFRWRRPVTHIKNESKERLFGHLRGAELVQAEISAERLKNQYYLHSLHANSTADNYRENLYYLELLEHALDNTDIQLPAEIRAADIGVSHWFYIQALYSVLKWWHNEEGRDIHLSGYEIDAYRIYRDFHSRYDHVVANIRQLKTVEFIPSGFTRQPEQYDVICMLFPFIFTNDHLKWGLLTCHFQPQQLLEDAWSSLSNGGILIIANQGEREHHKQLEMLARIGAQPAWTSQNKSHLYHYNHEHYVLSAIKR